MKMADSTITIKPEYRPCKIDGKRALFHKWAEYSDIYAPSILKGGHSGGVLKYVVGIVEYEDGTTAKVAPEKVVFVDSNVNRYFAEHKTEKGGADNVGK